MGRHQDYSRRKIAVRQFRGDREAGAAGHLQIGEHAIDHYVRGEKGVAAIEHMSLMAHRSKKARDGPSDQIVVIHDRNIGMVQRRTSHAPEWGDDAY
jgi:hypothetical protein